MASFATTPTTLANLNHLTPSPIKGLFGGNYLPLTGTNGMDFTQQFLPEVYEKEVERFGKRTVSGFLRMVGAEMPMASDRIVWSEQGRLHIAYDNVSIPSVSSIKIPAVTTSSCLLGTGMTFVISDGTITHKGIVTGAATTSGSDVTYAVELYDTSDHQFGGSGNIANGTTGLNLFVYGSEYKKGSVNVGNSIDASFTQFDNKPIIIRDKYTVNGSDVAQIGWVEVTTEMGTGGYLWYLKSEHESRLRFEDYLEMSMVEAEKALDSDNMADKLEGSEGLFAAIQDRGLVYNASDFDGAGGLSQFDDILAELDKQGAIEENMLFLDRAKSLEIDNMLAAQNSYGAGGTSYGVFNNEEDMALN